MASVATSSGVTGSAQMDASFIWRRLHSLSGLLPVGAYLCFHIYENLGALRGAEAYNETINHVNTMLPRAYFYLLELAVVIGPLLFHSLYGFYIASTGASNVGSYPYSSNWAYWAQRISGYVAFVYLLLHVGVLRVAVTLGGFHLGPHAAPAAGQLDLVTYADVAAHLGNPEMMVVRSWMAGTHMFVIYVIGTLLTIFHFTNGLNGFAWTWGIAVGRVAQARVKVVGWILFVALGAATLNILFHLRFAA
jgi:succinate dehydrogenase / fumarate reductase, cytochrome b subunit